MIHVTHHGYDRSSWQLILRTILFFKRTCFLILWFYKFYLITKFIGYYGQRFGIKPLVDGDEHTQAHTC